MAANQQVQSINSFQDQYNDYDQLMDQAWFSGQFLGHVPGLNKIGLGQSINALISQMSLSGIEKVRNAMGIARFSIPDLNVALSMNPQNTWSKEQRNRYGAFLVALKLEWKKLEK